MPLFDRGNKLPDTGTYAEEQEGRGNTFLLEDNPLSHLYQLPELGSSPATNLVLYMIAIQKKQFGETILAQQSQKILVRNCKLLLKKYDPELIARTIAYCGIIKADHPFSFAFVERFIGKVAFRVKGLS